MALLGRTPTRRPVEVCEGVPALVAVLGEAGSIAYATSGFVDRFDVRDGILASFPDEVELIMTGQADHVPVSLDGVDASLDAVIDKQRRRLAVLMIAPDGGDPGSETVSPVFDEPLDDSPAILWLKDLDGRYLRVNQRYLDQIGTDAESVCGRTDPELTAAGSIEGLRLEDEDLATSQPLELEYLIGAFEERPALAALRFALRDADGQPTATCSVAAPLADAALARSECDRLMRLDRWRRLDASAIRQELLDEWDLTLSDGSWGPPLDRDERVAAALAERDEALAAATRLERELLDEREELSSLRASSEQAAERANDLDGAVAASEARAKELDGAVAAAETRANDLESAVAAADARASEMQDAVAAAETRANDLESAVAAADARVTDLQGAVAAAEARAKELEHEAAAARSRAEELDGAVASAEARAKELDGAVAAAEARADELAQSLAREETQVNELRAELAAARAELEEHVLPADGARTEESAPADDDGPRWGTGAQHAFSAALASATEWRSVLEQAIGTLGTEGGWDATIAWCSERPSRSLRCGFIWRRDPTELTSFESRAWKCVVDPATAEFGRARNRTATTCLLDLQSAEDPLLRAAGQEGIGSAMLVPISDGGDMIAMLGLLARGTTMPNPDLLVSLDAIALQLVALARLLKFTDDRTWRIGRF